HWADHEAEQPFDLAQGPLIRGRLLHLSAREHVLLLTLHHIVADGWSLGVLMRELDLLYRAYAHEGMDPSEDPLPAPALQYADYTLWQRQWLSGALLQQQLAYWRERLAGAPALTTLPGDRPRPALQDYRGASLAIELDAELTAGLKALSQRHGTTLYMTLLAGWAALVARLSGQDEVV
ncbi:condensation domain-containing protein, partial [Pelomonas sp. CA6]|uniref:condensation domain-containing protein n=1 Tax=Pelomonas sp. CA6 TaxID=2907999 RepID=UPI001F4BD09C